MNLTFFFESFFHYLIHPFKTHESWINPSQDAEFTPMRIGVYESLTASWIFVVINGIFRIIIVNFLLILFQSLAENLPTDITSGLVDFGKIPSYYFVIASTVLNILFYPVFGFFIIKLWDIIIRFYARALGVSRNHHEASDAIISVSLSSYIFLAIPIFGPMFQGLSQMLLMYAGFRKQLGASPILSICMLLTPALVALAVICFIMMITMVLLSSF